MSEPPTSPAKIDEDWWVLLSATVGLFVSHGPIMTFTFGVFLVPLASDFGWDRRSISLALTLHLLAVACMTPVVGKVIDRVGPRAFLLRALCGFSLGIASLGFMQSSARWHVYAWFIAVGVIGAGVVPTAYARAVCAWFHRRRGLALGISLSGVGIGTALTPPIAYALLQALGWRYAYPALGLLSFLVAFPMVYLLLRDPDPTPDDPVRYRAQQNPTKQELNRSNGYTKRDAVRQPAFWLLLCVFFTAATAITGTSVHLVPLLADASIEPAIAARVASFLGIALIVGRVSSGYLMDRLFAPYVTMAFFVVATGGMLVLATDVTGILAVLGTVSVGLGVGAEIDVMAYLTSRYFGLRSFAELYGYQFAAFTLGSALGPYLMGIGFDMSQSYEFPLIANALAMGVACALLSRLGPYPRFV